jgi:hypothetical protein
MKKQWISVKCGLSRDPKHRQAMGESIWLFLHILDTASWDDGIVHDWKDEAEAEEMGMPVRTLREHRRRLDELGYIDCKQKQYTQDIVIHNWTNPREYSGKVYNKQSDTESEASKPQGDTQGYIQGSTKDVTPTLDSKNQITKDVYLSKEDYEQCNRKSDYILATNEQSKAWKGREQFRADLLEYADWYHKVTGQQVRTKAAASDWWKALTEWQAEGLTIDDLQAALDNRRKYRTVASPNELTKDAAAIHALPKPEPIQPRKEGQAFYG